MGATLETTPPVRSDPVDKDAPLPGGVLSDHPVRGTCIPTCPLWGTCHCGCGQETRAARCNNTAQEWVGGWPLMWRQSHAPRSSHGPAWGVATETLRPALAFLKLRHGSWHELGQVLGVATTTVWRVAKGETRHASRGLARCIVDRARLEGYPGPLPEVTTQPVRAIRSVRRGDLVPREALLPVLERLERIYGGSKPLARVYVQRFGGNHEHVARNLERARAGATVRDVLFDRLVTLLRSA